MAGVREIFEIVDKATSPLRKIAQEMHFSETTFITSGKQENGGYDVRIFTPAIEVP